MGFQGQLSSVNLTDIFQTLQMNRQTGTLSVTSPSGNLHLYFDGGQISLCSSPLIEGKPFLLNALLRKNLLTPEQVAEVHQRRVSSQQSLRDLLLAGHFIGEPELDEVCAWCVEELSCPIFEWHEGDFTFTDGPPVNELVTEDIVAMGRVGLATTQLVLEATRRKDEWKRIREVITDANALYMVDNDGRSNLRNLQTDPEMLKVLRYLDGRHALDEIATAVGVTKFDTFAITAQLVLAGVARQRTPEEIVVDAQELRSSGALEQAKTLLENILATANVPEVIRPLAEICTQLKQAPRAVELYLELIQIAQDQGNLEQARADLDTVLELSPDDPDLQFDRAKVLSELGAMEEAAGAYVAAAQAYLGTRDTARAIDACHRAKNLLPRSPDPHRFLAKAYLMDGQTENALVEYKSLWHALLSSERPRRAIEILHSTLETDCRFNNIKEQVLNHAQNSEAIKTSKSTRMLVNLVIVLLLIGAGWFGINYYQNVVRVNQAKEKIQLFKAAESERINSGQYAELFDEIKVLRQTYGTTTERQDIEQLDTDLRHTYESNAADQVKKARDLLPTQREQALTLLASIPVHFPGTPAEDESKALISSDAEDQVTQHTRLILDGAQRKWSAFDWDGALADIQPLILHPLPKAMAEQVNSLASSWSNKVVSAKDLFERASAIESAGRDRDALEAFRRAAKGKGEQYAAQARDRLAKLEVRLATETGKAVQQALEHGDDKLGFDQLDQLKAQCQSASTKDVSEVYARLELPFTIKIDSHLARVIIKHPGQGDQQAHAPAGAHGPWSVRITFLPGETVTVEVRRPGFTVQTLPIAAQSRHSQASIQLSRGPLWQTDLGGIPLTSPVATGKFVLIGTNKGTLEVVDVGLGTSKPVTFPATVDEFKAPPVVFQNFAYIVLDNRLFVIDVATHNEVWRYPPGDNQSPLQLTGSLWVQDHELIPNQLLFFLGARKGEVLTFSLDQRRIIPYQSIDLHAEITGLLVGDQFEPNHTYLYVPSGNQLQVFDTSSATEKSPSSPAFQLHTRGEVVGRVVHANVGGHAAMLAIDNSGLLVAVDVNPNVPDIKRAIASWAIDGTGVGIVVNQPANVAYLALAEGRVVACDLAHPGQLLWRSPAQANYGALVAAPVIGNHGIYVADAAGLLHCIDPATGTERWNATLSGPVSAGILSSEGRLFVPTRNGMIACFEEGDE